jgi:carbonic anhydrase/acetyltransferase-like protein (isoleucine patch superfamily)
MGACCVRKESVILSNSIIKNKSLNKDSSMIDSSSLQVCHIEKNLEKIESSGPILKLLMKKQDNNVNDTKNDDKNNSTKITKVLNI